MFESWIGELITRFVGHFLDVKKDQLRVSLWSGALDYSALQADHRQHQKA
jgi:hypothetical protein